nr:NADH dehydrogenase subunit 6 [Metopina sagittata]
MFQNFLIISMILISLMFLQMNHPLAMGITLLLQTILISIFSGMLNDSFWFSYILFLVFLGGMLILFIYVTSLASNEMFSFSSTLMTFMFTTFSISFLIIYFYDSMITNFFFENQIHFIEHSSLIKLFNYPNNLITILLMNYLLLTLVAVVKITNIFYGPLRQMFN